MSFLVTLSYPLFAQQAERHPVKKRAGVADIPVNTKKPLQDSIIFIKGACKNLFISVIHYEFAQPEKITSITPPDKTPFLSVHGNILYNFSYRSYIDTPFTENDVMQHLVQTNLNFLIKGKYPLRMTLSNRSSNSPYFKNATDVTLQFNRQQLLEHIKNDLRQKATSLVNTQNLAKLESDYKQKINAVQQLQGWLSSPARAQEMVEEKERQLRSSQEEKANVFSNGSLLSNTDLPNIEEIAEKSKTVIPASVWKQIEKQQRKFGNTKNSAADSLNDFVKESKSEAAEKINVVKDSNITEKIQARQEELTKLQSSVKQDEQKMYKEKKHIQDSVNQIKREISSLSDGAGLYAFMKRNSLSRSGLTKGQRLLLSINRIGIGRSWVDYSELTVKNVSLTGVNIELNPSPYYIAAAAGKLNYRYRDFILKNNRTLPNQSLALIRGGVGQIEKNYFILTLYNGKKEILNSSSASNPSYMQRVLGISAEARVALNENNYVVVELAKSSYGNVSNTQSNQSSLSKAFNWNVHSNEAYSIKLFSRYPQTDTKITGYYRKMGENFQSFNLYPTGSNQEAWMGRVNQSFWKRKLNVDASVRKNDFMNNPIALPSFASSIIFKAVQVTLRIPKYPFVSVGYYPSSQLSVSNNNILTESQYNTFNALVSHNYTVKGLSMNSNAVYTKFYNSGSDSGFIYYNASSYTITQSFYIGALTLQAMASVTDQQNLDLVTLEPMINYQFKNKISVSGSFKWSRLDHRENLFGGTAGLNLYLKKLGTLQLSYDKSWLPGYSRVLIPVDIGRMSFYREF